MLVDVGRIGEIRIRPQAIAPRVHDIGGTVKSEIQRLGYVSTIAVIGAPGGWRPARQSRYILRSITGWRFRFIIVTTRFSAVGLSLRMQCAAVPGCSLLWKGRTAGSFPYRLG